MESDCLLVVSVYLAAVGSFQINVCLNVFLTKRLQVLHFSGGAKILALKYF